MRNHVLQNGAEDGRGVENLALIGNLNRELGGDRIVVEDATQPGPLGALEDQMWRVKVAAANVVLTGRRCAD